MTTTHTFQGLKSDGKTSSRVLNPPGGATSGIFGSHDDQSQSRPTNTRNNAGSGNRFGNDTVGSEQNSAAGGQKNRPQRSGDNSFHNIFGRNQTSADNTQSYSSTASLSVARSDNYHSQSQNRRKSRAHHKSPDTFSNIFGEKAVKNGRQMFKSVSHIGDDSFTRVFGQSSLTESSHYKKAGSCSSSLMSCRSDSGSALSSPSSQYSISSAGHTTPRAEVTDDALSSLSSRASLSYSPGNTPKKLKRYSDRGAYNPITGEAYEQAAPTKQPELPTTNSTSVSEATSQAGIIETPEASDSTSSSTISNPEDPPVADQDKAAPAEDKIQHPATPMPPPAQTNQQKKQQQQSSNIFGGGAEEVKEHRSTRVSQPPGGRSSKLW